jgi:hypothetical protein
MYPRSPTRTLLAAAGLLTLAIAGAAATGDPDDPDEPPPAGHGWIEPARLPEDRIWSNPCSGCHGELAQEWAVSAHGLSWLDERYQRSLRRKRDAEKCWSCHVPEPLHLSGVLAADAPAGTAPPARAPAREAHELGVSCRTCHLGEGGVVLGPTGREQAAHRSALSRWFESPGVDRLCSACHSTDVGPVIGVAEGFLEGEPAASGASCVGCHMPEVTRVLDTDADGAPTETRPGRSHRILGPADAAFLASAFELAAAREGEEAALLVTNAAGHRVPGLVGRELWFRARLLDASGAVLADVTHVFDTVAFLRTAETVRVPLGPGGTRVQVVGEHFQPEEDEPVVFLAEAFELEE